jgi:hypothetical protein
MNLTRNRIRSIGWAFVLTVCIALTVALTLRVNAVKGQVRQTENRIVALKREVQALEVEFQTRANQQQLAALNSVEFGYVAPGAKQYIEGERQLAALGVPRAPGAPKPIRMAHAVSEPDDVPFLAMVSPVASKPDGGDVKAKASAAPPASARALAAPEVPKVAVASDDLIAKAIAGSAMAPPPTRARLAGGIAD